MILKTTNLSRWGWREGVSTLRYVELLHHGFVMQDDLIFLWLVAITNLCASYAFVGKQMANHFRVTSWREAVVIVFDSSHTLEM